MVLTFVCTLASPGTLVKLPKPKPQSRPMKSPSLRVAPASEFLNSDSGDSTVAAHMETTSLRVFSSYFHAVVPDVSVALHSSQGYLGIDCLI